MKTVVALMVSMVLVGCAANVVEQTSYKSKETTLTIPSEVLSAAKDAWMATGHEDPSQCVAPRVEVVDFETFRAWCHQPSCAEGYNEAVGCAHACTQNNLTDRGTFIVWAGDSNYEVSGIKPVSLDIVLTHETFHVWEYCTTGKGDSKHTDAMVWSTKDGAEEKNPDNAMDLYREMSKVNGLDKLEMALTPSK